MDQKKIGSFLRELRTEKGLTQEQLAKTLMPIGEYTKERIREIATIKVLGFHARESAAYVFKENLFLTALGSMVGLVGGIFLLKFVMSQIKIDMVWFTARLTPLSFVWAVVLTMLSACIVDFLLYFKLEKINMAEALKSVE